MPATSSVSPSGNQDIDGLLYTRKWAVSSFTFSFPTSTSFYEPGSAPSGETTSNFGALNATQQNFVRNYALSQFAAVANVAFTEITESTTTHADLRFAKTDATDTAWGYFPASQGYGGDTWYRNSGGDYDNPVIGNYAAHTFLHEIGHAFGLEHGHDAANPFGKVPNAHDSVEYTIMTYRSYVGGPLDGYTYGGASAPQTLMQNDIAALQYLYGANYNTNSGNTVYSWDPTTGQTFINGVSMGAVAGNKIFMTLWDGNGIDTYDLSAYSTNLTIDLQPGAWSTFSTTQRASLGSGHSAAGNVANALLYNNNTQSLIENAIGGSGNDTIIGNVANNQLSGGGGSDSINGLGGSDLLWGGAGNDILNGGDSLSLTSHQASIFRLYQAALDRAPDNGGLNYWTNKFDTGSSLTTIASGFVNSPEFQSTYGSLTNTQFVTLLYNNVLERAPDSGGLNYWVGQLNGGASRQSIVVGFSESPEFQTNTQASAGGYATAALHGSDYGSIYRIYGATLDREPDAGGFQHWVSQSISGIPLTSITTGFINSPEFQSVYGTLNNNQFVTLLYNNVLNRAPDSGGLSHWTGLLNAGASRETVVLGFSESPEYQNNTNATLINFMKIGLPGWKDELTGDAGNDFLFGGQGSDKFIFDATQVGSDRVFGLEPWDQLQFTNFGYTTSAQALSHMTQIGQDVIFSDQSETITFFNTQLATLQKVDFLFS